MQITSVIGKMKLSKFFKPDFPKVILFMGGVIVGLSVSVDLWWKKILMLVVAIFMYYYSEYVRGVMEERENGKENSLVKM